MGILLGIGNILGIQQALNQILSGIYMVTNEEYYMCEEDNENNLLIEE